MNGLPRQVGLQFGKSPRQSERREFGYESDCSNWELPIISAIRLLGVKKYRCSSFYEKRSVTVAD